MSASEGREMVEKAIRFLDTHHSNKQWRDKIDLTTLDLYFSSDCILGQIDGRYGSSPILHVPGFKDVEAAFCSNDYRPYWVELIPTTKPALEGLVGSVWLRKDGSTSERVVLAEYSDGGEDYVAIKRPVAGSLHVSLSVKQLKSEFTPKPKWVKGQIYRNADFTQVFVCVDDEGNMERLTSANNKESFFTSPGYSTAEFYVQEFGPLTPANYKNSSRSSMSVTVQL